VVGQVVDKLPVLVEVLVVGAEQQAPEQTLQLLRVQLVEQLC
jgi:hypothetical protein